MEFSYKELTVLNQMISIAMLSGKIALDECVEAIHKKITGEIADRNKHNHELNNEFEATSQEARY